MSAEFAFLLGFIIGQWVIIIALWSAIYKLAKTENVSPPNNNKPSNGQDDYIYLTARNISDPDEE